MIKDALFSSDWVGRFFLLPGRLSTTDELREFAASREWSPKPSRRLQPLRKEWSFCSQVFPNEGGIRDLDEGAEGLHYQVQDGCSVVALRMDARSVPPHQLRLAIHDRSMNELSRGYDQLSGWLRREYKERVEAELLPNQSPRSRIFPVLIIDDNAFVYRCPGADIKEIKGLLASLIPGSRSRVEIDPMVWDASSEEDVGFFEMGQLFLDRLVSRGSLDLDADTHLTGLQIGEEAIRLRSRETSERAIALIQSAQEHRLDQVSQISLRVDLEGGDVADLEIRSEGVCRIRTARAEGGLPREMLRARWDRAQEACARVQEVARALRDA